MKLDRNQLINEINELLKDERNRQLYDKCKRDVFKDCNVDVDNIPLEVVDRDILFAIKTLILDERNRSDIIYKIHEHLKRNDKWWDLTDNIDNPIVYDDFTNYPIPDLIINNDDSVCACIPIKFFSINTLKAILNVI